MFETQEKRDSSARSAPRNDKYLSFSAACLAAGLFKFKLPRNSMSQRLKPHQFFQRYGTAEAVPYKQFHVVTWVLKHRYPNVSFVPLPRCHRISGHASIASATATTA